MYNIFKIGHLLSRKYTALSFIQTTRFFQFAQGLLATRYERPELITIPGDTYSALLDSELSSGNLALDENGIFWIVLSKGLKVANDAHLRSEDAPL